MVPPLAFGNQSCFPASSAPSFASFNFWVTPFVHTRFLGIFSIVPKGHSLLRRPRAQERGFRSGRAQWADGEWGVSAELSELCPCSTAEQRWLGPCWQESSRAVLDDGWSPRACLHPPQRSPWHLSHFCYILSLFCHFVKNIRLYLLLAVCKTKPNKTP